MAASVTPQKPFLQQCNEDLDPDVLSTLEQKASLWKMADVTSIAAFSILTAGAFIATALFAPVFVPLTGITAFGFLEPVNKLRESFSAWTQEAAERASQLRNFQNHYQSLSGLTPAQLQRKIDERGIYNIPGMQRECPQLTTLKPLLARHMFWEDRVDMLQNKATQALSEAANLAVKNDPENRKEILVKRCEALTWEKKALESKCRNAFINAVIRYPNYSGNISDLGAFTKLSGLERAVDAANGIEGTERFFVFGNRNIAPIQYGEAKQSSVAILGQRMLTAM